MDNKGFTLIELLATVALLAIISVISFVSINGVIQKNKEQNCKTLAGNIKTAAMEYFSDNRYKSSVINGKTVITGQTAEVLVNQNYLTSPIKNPYTSEVIQPSKIVMTVNFNSDYTVKKVTLTSPDYLVACQ